MPTRADFYVGRGEQAEWLGSIAYDGYPDGIAPNVLEATEEAAYREAVDALLTGRDDATFVANGWPWPWEDSKLTDYAYALDEGKVHASCFGSEWFDPLQSADDGEEEGEYQPRAKTAIFPNMKAGGNVVLSGKRSGLMLISLGPDGLKIE